jgi:hypothetical protein
MLNISDKTLAALDRIRKQRGIRTRAKAIEVIALQAAPEHPLEEKLRQAKTVRPTKLEAQLAKTYLQKKQAGTVKTHSPTEALKLAAALRALK